MLFYDEVKANTEILNLSRNLAKFRQENVLTTHEMAKVLGMMERDYIFLEGGGLPWNMPVDALMRAAKRFNVRIADLFRHR